MTDYRFDNAWERGRERLAGIERIFDSSTIRYLDGLGVGDGWRCLELGAGGGTIAAWLCDRVGGKGQVVATDLDTRFLAEVKAPNLEVLTHDVSTDGRPGEPFDLIQRLLLEWVQDREAVLKRLVTWLAPGGWLLAEDFQWSAKYPIGSPPPFDETVAMVIQWLASVAYEPDFGSRPPAAFSRHGLVDIGSEARTVMVHGALPDATFYRLSIEQLRGPVVASGMLTDAQVDAALERIEEPTFAVMMPCLVSTWGRMPGD
ncbi:MAG: class I SAM-dependent methyltransferase [Egibacteraceae bacterium]